MMYIKKSWLFQHFPNLGIRNSVVLEETNVGGHKLLFQCVLFLVLLLLSVVAAAIRSEIR